METANAGAGSQALVRQASAEDADGVAGLAAELAQSFAFSREKFLASYPALLADDSACVLVAVSGHEQVGYLLGFRHLTFYANGVPVALKKFPTDIPLTWDNEGLADRSRIFAASLSSERETLLGYRRPAVMRVRQMAETRLPGFQLVVCPHIINKVRFTE
jgi:hypothetical protein